MATVPPGYSANGKKVSDCWDCAMMGYYVWGIICADECKEHKRQSRSHVNF